MICPCIILAIEVDAERIYPLAPVLLIRDRTVAGVPCVPKPLFDRAVFFRLHARRLIDQGNRDTAFIGSNGDRHVAAVVFTTTSAGTVRPARRRASVVGRAGV